MRTAKLILLLILLLVITTVTVQNAEVTTFRFLWWELTMSRILLLGLFFLTGIVLGVLAPKLWSRAPTKLLRRS